MSNCLCPSSTLAPILDVCDDSYGQLQEVYIADYCDIDTITITGGTTVTAISMLSGATFTTVQLRKFTANVTITPTLVENTDRVEFKTDVNFKFNKFTADRHIGFQNIVKGRKVVIGRFMDGTYQLYGDKTFYMTLSAGSANSGVASADTTSYDVTLTNTTDFMPLYINMPTLSTILDAYAM